MRLSDSKIKGDSAELLLTYKLHLSGATVSLPFGDNGQYDLIADWGNGKLYRVQVKKGKHQSGSLTWSAISHGSKGNHDYEGQADLFGVADLRSDKAYLYPVCSCGSRRGTLRLDPLTTKAPLKALGWAKDFEIKENTDGIKSLDILQKRHTGD